jgi:hypothetical protein
MNSGDENDPQFYAETKTDEANEILTKYYSE